MKTKKIFFSIIFLLGLVQLGKSQLIIPKFAEATKVDRLSDDAEESNIFTFNNGNNIYFYRSYIKGEGDKARVLRQNIWYSSREGDEWEKPDRLFTMDDFQGENIIIGSSRDGKKVYIFQTIYHPTEDSLSRKIGFINKSNNGKWSDFTEITIPGLVLGENYYHFHLSHDEKILMMSMSPNDELLDEDIYVSLKGEDGKWSKIIDLGPTINTKRVEISPFIDNDGKTLFFSSEGHDGFGGSDVFVSYRLDDSWTKWTTPKNLGDKVNNRDFDEYFVATRGNEFFFTSSRNSDNANIFFTTTENPIKIKQAQAKLMSGKQPVSAAIDVLNSDMEMQEELKTNEDGIITYIIPEKNFQPKFRLQNEVSQPTYLYLMDKDGNMTKRLMVQDDLLAAEVKEESNTEVITARVVDSKGEIHGNEKLMIKDQNGFTLKEVSSNKSGIVEFSTSANDKVLIPKSKTCDDLIFTNIKLMDREGNLKSKLKDGEVIDKGASLEMARNNNSVGTKTTTSAKSSPKSSAEPLAIINYEFNAISINRDEYAELRPVIRKLNKDKDIKVRLIGYTDEKGTEELNLEISKMRATYLKRLLTIEGIAADRISIDNRGEANPIASNENKEGRYQNRRVEILLQP